MGHSRLENKEEEEYMGRQLLGWLLFFTLSHARCLAVQHIRQDTSWISGATKLFATILELEAICPRSLDVF